MSNQIEITKELLQTIYDRAVQYSIIAFGPSEPDRIQLQEWGKLTAIYVSYCCGESDITEHSITFDNLTQDLDEVARIRKEQESEQQRLNEIKRKEDAAKRITQETERRRLEYLKLKREFEQEK